VDEPLTSSVFAPHVGEPFHLTPQGGGPFEALLTSCEETSYGRPEEWQKAIRRVPFSLVFESSTPESHPQQTFRVTHPDLGALELFLVPLGTGQHGMRYEAIVS
jgi:hypothetical protein